MSTATGAVTGVPGQAPELSSQGSLAKTIDRWIFVFTAAAFVVITLVGFIPDSLTKISLVIAGGRPPFPVALHAHAILMGSFLLVLLTQSVLQATGRLEFHRRLGHLAAGLAFTLAVVGTILVPTMYHQIWVASQVAPPEAQAALRQAMSEFENIMLLQIQIGILFPLFLVIALAARKTDPDLHKRMMLLAVMPALAAATDRMTWLPSTLPGSPLTPYLYPLVAIAPLFVWDVVRTRSIPKAYLIAAAFLIPFAILVHSLWDTPWWHSVAQRIGGV